MSEIRATDLFRSSIAAEGPDSFEIRSANLVKGNLGTAEVGS